MIPRVWTDSTSPHLPYSTEAPVVERLLRHSSVYGGKLLILVWLACLGFSVGMICILPALPDLILDGLLIISWAVTIFVILGGAYLGASISGTQVRSHAYQLLWMTDLSDRALGSSLFVATVHQFRLGIAIMSGIMPLIIFGMTQGNGLWAVEVSNCPNTWERAWCQENSPPLMDLPVSIVVGCSLWLSLAALLPVGTLFGVWMGMRWRQTSIAGLTAVGMMSTVLLIVGTLGLWAVDSTPPLREPLIWAAELALFSGLMLILLTAVIFWREGLLEDEGVQTLLLVVGALVALGWALAFLTANPMTRGPLVNLFGTMAIPYGLLAVGLQVFWRGARTQVDD